MTHCIWTSVNVAGICAWCILIMIAYALPTRNAKSKILTLSFMTYDRQTFLFKGRRLSSGKTSAKYLVRIITSEHLYIGDSKVQTHIQLRQQRTQFTFRVFLGLCNVNRRLVESYAQIAYQLNELLKKCYLIRPDPFNEGPTSTFETLSGAIIEFLIIALPKNELTFSAGPDVWTIR